MIEQVGEARAERRVGLGGTGLTQRALESGAIDVYPEYTGTLALVILKDPALQTPEALRGPARAGRAHGQRLARLRQHLRARDPGRAADRLGLRTVGDLARHPELRAAFSSGFLERDDGWPGLRARYGLGLARVEVMEHALTYRAIASGQVDVMDVFSTDGQLERLTLRLLDDDRRFFPDYSAVLLARREMTERYPRTWARLREALEGRLDGPRMARLNAMADLDGRSCREVAAAFSRRRHRRRPRAAHGDARRARRPHRRSSAAGADLGGRGDRAGHPHGHVAARYRRAGQLELP